jgi:hypothetical protein
MNPNTVPCRASTWLRWTSCAVFLLLLCGVALVPTASADLRPMQVVWTESFEGGQDAMQRLKNQGWAFETYTREDKIHIVPDDMGSALGICEGNWSLEALSLENKGGAGFVARTPTFSSMGIDPNQPYRIVFDYLVRNDTRVCWTYALASRHASLTVTDCDLVPGMVNVYLTDDATRATTMLGRLTTDTWHHIDVLVIPDLMRPKSDLYIRFDGVLVGNVEDWPAMMLRDRVQMIDMPYAISDGSNPGGPAGCFGAGRWDDVTLMAEIPDTPARPRGLDIHLAPNPFNPRTELNFVLPTSESARVMVYDLAGRLVRSLFDGRLDAGAHAFAWDGKDSREADAASGVYLFAVTIGKETDLVRAVLVR